MSIIKLFFLGGIFMYPLIIFFFLSLFFIFERALYYLFFDWKVSLYTEQILSGNYETIKKITSPFQSALIKNYSMFKNDKKKFDSYMEEDSKQIIDNLEKNLFFLNVLSGLSPIVGFLGTVWGMIISFKDINEAEHLTPKVAASGIYTALITTAFGLIIAVLCLMFFYLYSYVVKEYSKKLEKSVNSINLFIEKNQDEITA